jgi:signal transduction histidine kinase
MRRANWVWSEPLWMIARALVCVLAATCLLLSAAAGATGGAATQPVLELKSGLFLLSDAETPPADSAPWQPITLPDNWEKVRPDVDGSAWYRLQFDLPVAPVSPYAVTVTWLRTFGLVFMNGKEIGRSTGFGDKDQPPRPQLFIIPPQLLHGGTNILHIRLLVGGSRGSLSVPSIGEDLAVRPIYENEVLWEETIPLVIGLTSCVVGLLMLLLWLRRRQESLYGYFGLFAVMYAAYIFRPVNIPLPPLVWAGIRFSSTVIADVAMLVFALRYAGWRWPRFERVLWAYCVLTVLVACLIAWEPHRWISTHWRYPHIPLYFSVPPILAIGAWRRPPVERAAMLAAIAFQILAGFYEAAQFFVWRSLDYNLIEYFQALPLYMIISWFLAERFAASLSAAERLNAELEQRVEQKHKELEQNYQRVHDLEQQRAIAGERSRIMRDMHDGVGGQLISALNAVERGNASTQEIAESLRECLDDLRLTIDSMEPTEDDLLPVLGNLRYRLDHRLKQQGVALDWEIRELPKLACLTPQNVLHILRILQEAFTNVLKHAHATKIAVETGVDESGTHVFIRVRDNGKGFAGDHRGHGLASMQHRTKVIGGALDILPSPDGTTLTLLLPVS